MLKPFSLFAFAAVALLIPQAAEGAKQPKEQGKHCSNGVDDDQDGLIDGADPDCQKGNSDGDPVPDNVRAFFHPYHSDGSPTTIQGDTTCIDTDNDPERDEWHYVHETDSGCAMSPEIHRGSLDQEGRWRLQIQTGQTIDPIVVDRWAVVRFPAPDSVNSAYTGSLEDPSCPNLDVFIFEDPKYQDDDGDGVANDGGVPVTHTGIDPSCTVDNNVIVMRTEAPLFDLPDGPVVFFSHFFIAKEPSDPDNGLDGGRFWPPRFMLNYYDAWEKQTLSADNVVLRTTGDHLAELVEHKNGPVSKRIVGTYRLPVEVELKRVPVPAP